MMIMFNKIRPYMGGYIKYTYAALGVMFVGLIASAVPFFMVYRIIRPLLDGEDVSVEYIALHIAIIIACELSHPHLPQMRICCCLTSPHRDLTTHT